MNENFIPYDYTKGAPKNHKGGEFRKYQRILANGQKDIILISVQLNAVVANSVNGSEVLTPTEPHAIPYDIMPRVQGQYVDPEYIYYEEITAE